MSIIYKRQSIRNFNNKEVEVEKITSILESAMLAPSSKNKQPWQFIVLDNKELINDFSEAHPNWKILKNANKVIIVCGDLNIDEREKHVLMACSASTQNILLKCVELGLGAVWLGLYPDNVRLNYTIDKLNICENIVPISLVAIGYYDDEKQRIPKFNNEKVHFNKW